MHQQEKKALGEHKGQSSEQCMMCFFFSHLWPVYNYDVCSCSIHFSLMKHKLTHCAHTFLSMFFSLCLYTHDIYAHKCVCIYVHLYISACIVSMLRGCLFMEFITGHELNLMVAGPQNASIFSFIKNVMFYRYSQLVS